MNNKKQRIIHWIVFLLVLGLAIYSLSFKKDILQSEDKINGVTKNNIFVLDENEKIKDFLQRVKPNKEDDTFISDYIEDLKLYKYAIRKWNLDIVIAFYRVPKMRVINHGLDEPKELFYYNEIDAYGYIPTGKENNYRRVFFGKYEENGGDPEITSVFENDFNNDLGIVVSWEQRHYDYSGTDHVVYTYDMDLIPNLLNEEYISIEKNWKDYVFSVYGPNIKFFDLYEY